MSRAHKARQRPASTSHGEVASTTDTSEDNYDPNQHAPESISHGPLTEDEREVGRLREFLATVFPDEVDRTNMQTPESPVDTAIRLLTGLHAHTPPQQVARCTESFCNKPREHRDSHGWVHYG